MSTEVKIQLVLHNLNNGASAAATGYIVCLVLLYCPPKAQLLCHCNVFTDQDLRNIIDKLAQFVARNGPEFEKMTKNKQKNNPKFSFLYGGEHFNYYQYKVTTEQASKHRRWAVTPIVILAVPGPQTARLYNRTQVQLRCL